MEENEDKSKVPKTLHGGPSLLGQGWSNGGDCRIGDEREDEKRNDAEEHRELTDQIECSIG